MNANIKINFTTLAMIVLSLALENIGHGSTPAAPNSRNVGQAPLQASLAARLNLTPRGFIPNVGQLPNEAVKFVIRDSGVSVYFTDHGFALWNGQTTTVTRDGIESNIPIAPRWSLVDALPVEPVGGKALEHTVSYFQGNDQSKWHANVPAYRDLRYPEILNGVELRIETREHGFEYSFHVQPHSKLDLRLRYDGISALEKSLTGDLIVRTPKGHFTESRPVSFQLIDGQKRDVESRFELVSSNEYRIAVGAYDERHELVIDPVLDWSTFLGATYLDELRDVKVDPNGNICVAGYTSSTDLPDSGGFSTGPGVNYDFNLGEWRYDVFVAKFDASGTGLLWLGYLAGAGATGEAVGFNGLAADSAGNLYVGGYTASADFPVTAGAFQGNLGGSFDAFVTKIRSDGATILWSTFVGGADLEWGWGIALDPLENVLLTGYTFSTDFPVLSASDPTLSGARDAFVAKFNASGAIQWSTYLGGSGNADRGAALVANADGEIFIFGDTDSPDFATVGDTTLGGANDAFVTKLTASGVPAWTTLVGGSGVENDEVNPYVPIAYSRGDLALDSVGNILVAGETTSADFPVTAGAFDTTLGGTADGYVAKIASDGATVLWASYLGGSGSGQYHDRVWAIAVNPWDEVFLVGGTDSADFPVTTGALQTSFQGGLQDGFLTKLNAAGSAVLYSTYLGGLQGRDTALGITYDSGNVLVAGWAVSAGFPATAGAYQTGCASCSLNGWDDGYIMKFLDAFIAHDGFESGNYSGGSGWAGNWTATGDIGILTSSSPHSGTRHARLRSKTGNLRRSVNLPGATASVRLGFWAKVDSFEGNDRAYVRVKKSTSGSFTIVLTFTPASSDNKYHYYEIDVTSFLPASQLQVEFDAEMNASNDNWYLDDIRLVGTE